MDAPSGSAASAGPVHENSEHVLDLKNMQVDEKNLVMFRKKHLFVEMHELADEEWHETHRWNYGLEEDNLRKMDQDGKHQWTQAHLPTISVFGMMALRECLRPELIILDVACDRTTNCAASCEGHNRTLRTIAMEIVNRLVVDGQIEPGDAAPALDVLWAHLSLKKCVDHDDLLKHDLFTMEETGAAHRATHRHSQSVRGGGERDSLGARRTPDRHSRFVQRAASLARMASLLAGGHHHHATGKPSRDQETGLPGGDGHDDEHHPGLDEQTRQRAPPTTATTTPPGVTATNPHVGAAAAAKKNWPVATAAAGDAARQVKPPARVRSVSEGTPLRAMPPKKASGNSLRKKRSASALQMLASSKRLFESATNLLKVHDDDDKHGGQDGKDLVVPVHTHHWTPRREDPLKPDAEEEAVHILIDDRFDVLKSDAVVIVRLSAPVASGLEEKIEPEPVDDDGDNGDEDGNEVIPEEDEGAGDDAGERKDDDVEAGFKGRNRSTQGEADDHHQNNNPSRASTGRASSTVNTPKPSAHKSQDLLTRFMVLVLGPKLDLSKLSSVSAQLCRRRHSEMGAAAAALMQDDAVVRALYEARSGRELIEAVDVKLSSMRILPRTSRPTKEAVKRRASRMYQQLAELKRIAEDQAKERLKAEQEKARKQEQQKKKSNKGAANANGDNAADDDAESASRAPPHAQTSSATDVVALTNTGGRFVRLEYPDQGGKWGARERDVFTGRGFSIGALLTFAQKYAMPLLLGIALALILANERAGGYRRWAGASESDDDDDDSHDDHADVDDLASHDDGSSRRRLSGGGSGGPGHPTLFGLSIDGHDVTLHFLVNDVLMAFFFGLAVKEIAEAFQPGGSLFPPTKKAVNPMMGTVGGVLGPVVLYFVLVAIWVSAGFVGGYDFQQLATGWGIPTATDISVAWVTAVVVFGSGHPAINYLLLCAVIDDGIGLLIIAVAYPDPEHPLKPIYLLLVAGAAFVSYGLRRMRCARWEVYVFLAGPVAWFGLLFARVHPSLALCFVVPFMPIRLEPGHHSSSLRSDPGGGDDLAHFGSMHLVSHEEMASHASPLHDFEEAVKGFVDFFVLFGFGAVNAGVRFEDTGGFSLVIVLALLLGKTLGMTLGSSIAAGFGFQRPKGMSFRHLVVSGVISSVGLTVSLFIAGEAFSTKEQLEGQAKLGALFSLGPALVLVALANFSPRARRALLGSQTKQIASRDDVSLSKRRRKADDAGALGLGVLDDEDDAAAAKDYYRPDASHHNGSHLGAGDHKWDPELGVSPGLDGRAGSGSKRRQLQVGFEPSGSDHHLDVVAGLAGDGVAVSPRGGPGDSPGPFEDDVKDPDAIDYERDYDDHGDEDEFLEDVVVSNIENTLREIHRIEAQVEKRAGVRRSSTMLYDVKMACAAPEAL